MGCSILFLTKKSKYHKTQLEEYGMYVTKELYDINHKLSNYFKLKKKNEELLKENKKLKNFILNQKVCSLSKCFQKNISHLN